MISDIPELKIVIEHISSMAMVGFIEGAPSNVAATITAHHPVLAYKDVFNEDGAILNPHYYCQPVAKAMIDREAIIRAMTSGNPKFFFGSDSAPHLIAEKEKTNPPPGIFSAPVALPLLCHIFERQDALKKLEPFVSQFGADFYGFPLNKGTLVLEKGPWRAWRAYKGIGIFLGQEYLNWSIA